MSGTPTASHLAHHDDEDDEADGAAGDLEDVVGARVALGVHEVRLEAVDLALARSSWGWPGRRAGRWWRRAARGSPRSRSRACSGLASDGATVVLLGSRRACAGLGGRRAKVTRPSAVRIVRGSKPKGSSSRWAAISASSVSTSYVAPSATITPSESTTRPRAQLEGVGQVVGDHQHRHVERAQDVGELAARGGVEVGRRLVEHQDLRLHRQHGGDRDPAALAEDEVVRRPVGEVRHPDPVEGVAAPAARAPRRAARGWPARTRRRRAPLPMNSWSSGSWKTMPTRRRTSREVRLGDRQAGDRDAARARRRGCR